MMLTPRQRLAIIVCATLAALTMLWLARGGTQAAPRPQVNAISAQFDGAAAVEYTRFLAEEFPDRVTGSDSSRRAGEYLRAEFRKLGYLVASPTFSMWLHGERVQGENIVAQLQGDFPKSVAVLAHYDGQFTSHQAAEDNASGVGVLLELARVLRQRPHQRGLIFAATDAEEWGMIGARRLCDLLRDRNTVAVISIDYLNAGPSPALEIDCEGQFAGYTPPWLRELVVAAGRAQGVRVEQPFGEWEWIGRAIAVSFQDQGPLLRAGIPALNIATLTKQLEASRARYHTTGDVFRDFNPETFRMLGTTVEQAVSVLDGLDVKPAGSMRDFRLASGRYLSGTALEWMQLLGLTPVALASVFVFRNLLAPRRDATRGRFLGALVWVAPPWVATLALYALTRANVLKRYELYPATPKDPFLYQPPLLVVAPLLLILGAGFLAVLKLRPHPSRETFGSWKGVRFVGVFVAALAALIVNPYAMWLYLGIFAYGTLLLLPPRDFARRAWNAMWLLAALAPFVTLLYFFGREIFLGWRILWYLVLQAAYGVWSPWAIGIFILAVVLWVQLFWGSVVRGGANQAAERS